MIQPRHTRGPETIYERERTLRTIDLLAANTRSVSTLTTAEINVLSQEQRTRLLEFKTVTAADLIRHTRVDQCGCYNRVFFRRNTADYNTVAYICGKEEQRPPDVPYVCCICEALLRIDERRRLRPDDYIKNNQAFEEENFLVDYRHDGFLRTGFIAQYVELERQRRLREQENGYLQFRLLSIDSITSSSATREADEDTESEFEDDV